ncbi:hypothetical protein D3C81_1548430 [compost metagenome]
MPKVSSEVSGGLSLTGLVSCTAGRVNIVSSSQPAMIQRHGTLRVPWRGACSVLAEDAGCIWAVTRGAVAYILRTRKRLPLILPASRREMALPACSRAMAT